MKKEYNEYKKMMEERKRGFEDFIKEIVNLPKQEKDEILHWINIEVKNTLEALVDDFKEKFKNKMIETDYFCFYIKLQKEILNCCAYFSNKIKTFMSFDLDDYANPKNNIKKCPFCGEIWVRVEGCDGPTTCGNLPQYKDINTKQKSFFKYILKWSNRKFSYEKNEIKQNIGNDNSSQFQGKTKRGCSKTIIWKELPHLSDDHLLQIFEVKSIDEIKKILNDARFSSSSSKMEMTFDSNFYS